LNEKKINYYRLNFEDLDVKPYNIFSEKNFVPIIDSCDTVDSVWFRRTKLPNINIDDPYERNYILAEYDSLVSNLFQIIKAKKWLSHPDSIYRAENKLLQLRLAKDIGFKIPETLSTNEKALLKSFSQKFNGNIILKPLGCGRIRTKTGINLIYTNKLESMHLNNLDHYDLTPIIFQEFIVKEYELRITVVDGYVFSAKVESQLDEETRIDWRRKKLKFKSYKLPEDVEYMCVMLTKKLDLAFGAIDIIKNSKGEYIFLEINPNGQWAWIEIDTGLKISDAIINYLIT